MKLSLVIPCYNESQSLEGFSKEVFGILESLPLWVGAEFVVHFIESRFS